MKNILLWLGQSKTVAVMALIVVVIITSPILIFMIAASLRAAQRINPWFDDWFKKLLNALLVRVQNKPDSAGTSSKTKKVKDANGEIEDHILECQLPPEPVKKVVKKPAPRKKRQPPPK